MGFILPKYPITIYKYTIYIPLKYPNKSPGIFHGFSLPNWIRRLDLGISWRFIKTADLRLPRLTTREAKTRCGTSGRRDKKPWGFSRVVLMAPRFSWNPDIHS